MTYKNSSSNTSFSCNYGQLSALVNIGIGDDKSTCDGEEFSLETIDNCNNNG